MIELDPVDGLALSLHHAPGVYALLVGSGLSSAAGIPTGWQITLHLIRELATTQGVSDQEDWAAWFRDKYKEEPNYSHLLELIAPTASERQAVIARFIEPQEGGPSRRPTEAHHAIAKLVVEKSVRVIITTNFDRLIEDALVEAGIQPSVIASADALAGAMPLVHAPCTVIKVHGDYLDMRMKNIAEELDGYPPAIDRLLDEVFDRFGLVVVGWSAEWDKSLRAALLRCPNRRYEFYFASRGTIGPLAQDLITHRQGRGFVIEDADKLFARVGGTVAALRQSSAPHPHSASMAIDLAKRYLITHELQPISGGGRAWGACAHRPM